MNGIWLAAIILALAALAFPLAVRRANAQVGGETRRLHSRPSHYGSFAALATAAPALALLIVWSLAQPPVVSRMVLDETSALSADPVRTVARGLDIAVAAGAIPAGLARNPAAEIPDLRDRLRRLGVPLGAEVGPELLSDARAYRAVSREGRLAMAAAVLLTGLGGFVLSIRAVNPRMRARNRVEGATAALLLGASTIAILTTVGIAFSMLFETVDFFRQYPAADFFFGLVWKPVFEGESRLGLIPLAWGTLYISTIALVVAVPIGLFAAIYMAEYAGRRTRSLVKPLIEVLAGIPTIVYGLFALITVGPLLRDWFAAPLGLSHSGSSAMTAGLVMGIMLIPFVSSLSDDIITAVPRAMREGSLGLGATPSETIRQVVLPAALPGIAGAVLLAASRAIGETMIVVLGAGAAARLDLNPFAAMTTITVKIVSQLTGDTGFNSPETLVAFALGLTLFVATLGLNVLAQWIVRRYREQYE